MRIEEAIVYVMVQRNGGMTTDQIADAIVFSTGSQTLSNYHPSLRVPHISSEQVGQGVSEWQQY